MNRKTLLSLPVRPGQSSRRRWRRPGLAVTAGLALTLLPLAASAGPASAAANPACPSAASSTATSCTFTSNGYDQAYTVPAGVTAVRVTAVGAPGGSFSGFAGGNGASVTATVALPAGTTTLYAEAGTGAPGGISSGAGAVGGGASDVRTCPVATCDSALLGGAGTFFFPAGLSACQAAIALVPSACSPDSRLVVAGGGGGAGSEAGGGQAGDPSVTGPGAGGGVRAAGGSGGFGGTAGGAGNENADLSGCGAPGSAFDGLGGNTGQAAGIVLTDDLGSAFLSDNPICSPGGFANRFAGGTGGGGYYGGGAAGAYGGGGAGSSFWVTGATGTSMSTGTTGVPEITITALSAPQAITFTSSPPASAVYGGSYVATATASSGLPVSLSVDAASTAGACALSGPAPGSTVSFTGAGTCIIDAGQAGDADWAPAPQVQQTLTVNKAAQSINFTAPATGVAGGPAVLTATGGGSGNPVTFSVDSSSGAAVCSVSGDTVSYLAVGSCVIDASQAGDADYAAAPQVSQAIKVAYAVKLLYDPAKASKSGANVAVKLQLPDAAGSNLSAPGITVTVTGLSPSPAPGTAPRGTFTYLTLDQGPGYQLNVKTTGYPAGTYTLSFTAGSDPTTHTAQFVVS